MTDVFRQLEEQVAGILPPSCELAKVEVEGPQVVVYLKNMRSFYQDENFITKIASRLRKKVVVRADSSVLMPTEKALSHIKATVPPEAGIKEIRFDPNFHEVLIEAIKPGLVIGKGGSVLKNIIVNTGWSPRVLRTPTMPCETITAVRNSLLEQSEARKKFLTSVGKKLYAVAKPSEWVKITALGGFREVGRSCFLLSTPSSNIIIDCGINVDPSDPSKAYPYLNAMNLGLDQIDAVILSHAHLDHCLHPDSLVQLADGEIRRVEELKAQSIVNSFDFVSGKTESASASKGETKKPQMLRIQTNLSSIRATPEHRFFTVEGLEIIEKMAGELREGDFVASVRQSNFDGTPQPLPRIAVPQYSELSSRACQLLIQRRKQLELTQKQVAEKAGIHEYDYNWMESRKHKPTVVSFKKAVAALGLSESDFEGEFSVVSRARLPESTSEEFCQFLGYVLGDGNPHFPDPQAPVNGLAVTDKDLKNLEFYSALGEKVFASSSRLTLKADKLKDGRNRAFFSTYVTRLLFAVESCILARSRKRAIPKLVHKVSRGELAAFFRGLYDAEGNVGHHSVRLVSTSDALVRVAQMLLLRFGVLSTIEQRESKFGQFSKGPAYCLTITHPASLKAFAELIGFSCKAKASKLEKMLSKAGRASAERVDLIPLDGETLKQRLAEASLYETDFDSRISRYWLDSHVPSKATVESMVKTIQARIVALEGAEPSRKLLRSTQKKVEAMAGVSQGTVSMLERRTSTASGEVYGKVASVLQSQKASQLNLLKELCVQLQMLCSQELAWAKIRKIESETPPEKVYDLSVPGYENFVADGFIVHNSGFIPYLYAYGYEGPVYCTPPTRDMMVLLQQDCVKVMNSEGGKAPYSERDIKKELGHVITREYGEVTDVTPDVRFTFHNAGHMVGSAMVHVHIGEGLHNLVYSGDLKFGKTRVCDAATTVFPRAETFMMEATYGGRNDVKPRIEETETKFCDLVSQIVSKRGKVLVPVIASGRAQEIMCVLEEHFKDPDFVAYIDGMSKEASAIHTAYPEYLRRTLQRRILQNDSPFDKPMFKSVENNDHRKQIAESDEPCVIIAPSGMLNGGPSLQFLKMLAHDPRNALVLVSYQSNMTVGRRIQQGEREVPISDNHASKQETLKVNMQVYSMEGFSGHSDRSQLLNFIRSVRPKPSRVFTMHGDGEKCDELARTINKMLHIETRVPMCLDSMRLK